MITSMIIPSAVLCWSTQYDLDHLFSKLDFTSEETLISSIPVFFNDYIMSLRNFGVISGTYFMLIFLALIYMFYVLFNLIDAPTSESMNTRFKLSEKL